MSVTSRAALTTLINSVINDNSVGDITPSEVRQVLINLNESLFNTTDGAFGFPYALSIGVDLNTITQSGIYYSGGGSNRPSALNGYLFVLSFETFQCRQVFYESESNKQFTRYKFGTFTPWVQIKNIESIVEVDTTGDIDIDMDRDAERTFIGSDLINHDSDVTLSNAGSLRSLTFSFQITGGYKLTFLTGIAHKSFDGNWTGSLEWTSPESGYYLMTVRYDGTIKFIDIEGMYTTA